MWADTIGFPSTQCRYLAAKCLCPPTLQTLQEVFPFFQNPKIVRVKLKSTSSLRARLRRLLNADFRSLMVIP